MKIVTTGNVMIEPDGKIIATGFHLTGEEDSLASAQESIAQWVKEVAEKEIQRVREMK